MRLIRPDPPIKLVLAPRPKLQRQARITLHRSPPLRLARWLCAQKTPIGPETVKSARPQEES